MAAPDMQSIAGSFASLQGAFQPQRAAGASKTVHFDFSGREAGTWSASVHDGTFSYQQAPAAAPHATVAVDSDVWLQILRGELNPVSAFMSGKIKINGDVGLLMQFQNWFAQ